MGERNDKIVEIDSIVDIFAKKTKGVRRISQFEGDDMPDKPVMPNSDSEVDKLVDDIKGGGEEAEKEEGKEEENEEGKEKEEGDDPTEEISESLVENLSDVAEDNNLSGTDVVDIVKDIVQDEKGEAELVEEVEKEISARKARKARKAKRK